MPAVTLQLVVSDRSGGRQGAGLLSWRHSYNISDTQTTSLLWSINQAAECVKVRPSVEILDYEL